MNKCARPETPSGLVDDLLQLVALAPELGGAALRGADRLQPHADHRVPLARHHHPVQLEQDEVDRLQWRINSLALLPNHVDDLHELT